MMLDFMRHLRDTSAHGGAPFSAFVQEQFSLSGRLLDFIVRGAALSISDQGTPCLLCATIADIRRRSDY